MKATKILLVDDEEIFARNISRLLANRGYVVTAVNSGDAAIRELEKDRFDVMVLDLKMPGLDGIATLTELRKLGLTTDTLVLTGHGSIDTALEAMKLGAYDYLTKPVDIHELVKQIETVRDHKRHTESTKAPELTAAGPG